MSCRIDTTSLIAGACVIGNRGLGVLASTVPSTGEHGAGYLYNDLSLPADAGKEVRGLILTTPSAGTFTAFEDSSFTLTGAADGAYTFSYRLFVDGVDGGTASASITIGAGSGEAITGSGALTETTTGTLAASGTFTGAAEAITGAGALLETGVDTLAAAGTFTAADVDFGEPLTLMQARLAARLDPDLTLFDADLMDNTRTARQMAEHATGREYVAKTRTHKLADWPAATFPLPMHEATAVAISWWDGTIWQSLPAEEFLFYECGNGTGVAPAPGLQWPTLGDVPGGPRVKIDITAGSSTPSTTTPEPVRRYIKALVAYWQDMPSAVADRSSASAPYLERLLDEQRLYF